MDTGDKLYNNEILRDAIENNPALNPTKVAAAADVSITTVHNAMNGEDIRISNLRRIAAAANVDLARLVEAA
jgi:predicted transcriptional regulator